MTLEFRIGAVLSTAVDVYLANLLTFTVLALIVGLPTLFLPQLWSTSSFLVQPSSESLVGVFSHVLYPLLNAMVIYGTVRTLGRRQADLVSALKIAEARFLILLGLGLVVDFLAMLGLILCVIPGLIVWVLMRLSAPACTVERLGVVDSIMRSRELVRGHGWQIFGLGILVWSPALLLVFALAKALGADSLYFKLSFYGVGAIFTTWSTVVLNVAYLSLRQVHEGVDFELIAETFD